MLHISSSDEAIPMSSDRQSYIEPGLWKTWTSLRFLVPENPQVHLLSSNGDWPAIESGPAAIFVWPYGDWRRVWSMLGGPIEVGVAEGALSQGDRDPEPFNTYRAFYITPSQPVSAPLVRFQSGVELVDAKVSAIDQGVDVEFLWHATERLTDDYTAFVHYMRDGQRIGQHDAQPAGGHYPTSRWNAGDLIHDDHRVALSGAPDPDRDQIIIGLYRAGDGRHLDVLDEADNSAGNFAVLPVTLVEKP